MLQTAFTAAVQPHDERTLAATGRALPAAPLRRREQAVVHAVGRLVVAVRVDFRVHQLALGEAGERQRASVAQLQGRRLGDRVDERHEHVAGLVVLSEDEVTRRDGDRVGRLGVDLEGGPREARGVDHFEGARVERQRRDLLTAVEHGLSSFTPPPV